MVHAQFVDSLSNLTWEVYREKTIQALLALVSRQDDQKVEAALDNNTVHLFYSPLPGLKSKLGVFSLLQDQDRISLVDLLNSVAHNAAEWRLEGMQAHKELQELKETSAEATARYRFAVVYTRLDEVVSGLEAREMDLYAKF
ncbi:hypothetical protein HDV03_002850 [Kappamyces sp. JEL0829]|nr:hypothetical protein HDV03_002850 [Kappamyces sp. JEL0829]